MVRVSIYFTSMLFLKVIYKRIDFRLGLSILFGHYLFSVDHPTAVFLSLQYPMTWTKKRHTILVLRFIQQ